VALPALRALAVSRDGRLAQAERTRLALISLKRDPDGRLTASIAAAQCVSAPRRGVYELAWKRTSMEQLLVLRYPVRICATRERSNGQP
jgi:hypothetical protein